MWSGVNSFLNYFLTTSSIKVAFLLTIFLCNSRPYLTFLLNTLCPLMASATRSNLVPFCLVLESYHDDRQSSEAFPHFLSSILLPGNNKKDLVKWWMERGCKWEKLHLRDCIMCIKRKKITAKNVVNREQEIDKIENGNANAHILLPSMISPILYSSFCFSPPSGRD